MANVHGVHGAAGGRADEQAAIGGAGDDAREVTSALVANVTARWGDDVLTTIALAEKATFVAGEHPGADLVLSAGFAGDGAAPLVRFDGDEAVVAVPPGGRAWMGGAEIDAASFVVREGEAAEVALGASLDVHVRVAVERAFARPRRDLAAVMRQSGIGGTAASAVVHGALFAAFALFMPALGASDAEAMERDQIVTMRRFLDASAEAEKERVEEASGFAGEEAQGQKSPEASGGQRSTGAEGALGTADNQGHARFSAAGHARRVDETLPREKLVAEAGSFGILALLSAYEQGDPNTHAVAWGSVLNGADATSHTGDFWSANVGDAFGTGEGLSGTGEGGGGVGTGFGVNDFGGLARSLDRRIGGGEPGGFGGCPPGKTCGLARGGHAPPGIKMRLAGPIETNGRLPGEIIQRIVRLSNGRYRSCYESGLRTNPNLAGRVAVRFVIDREGAVATASVSGAQSDLPDESVRACVAKAFYGLTFPAPSGGTVTVSYPLVFSPE